MSVVYNNINIRFWVCCVSVDIKHNVVVIITLNPNCWVWKIEALLYKQKK